MLQIIIIVLLVAADQLTKMLIWAPLPDHGTVAVIPGVLNFSKVENEGASFGLFQGAQVFFIVMTLIVLAAAVWFMVRCRKKRSRYLRALVAVLFAGAAGNLIDRIAFGFVRDFIDFRLFDFWKWVFNIADAALVVGAILMAVYLLFFYRDKKPHEAADAAPAGGEAARDDDAGGETGE